VLLFELGVEIVRVESCGERERERDCFMPFGEIRREVLTFGFACVPVVVVVVVVPESKSCFRWSECGDLCEEYE